MHSECSGMDKLTRLAYLKGQWNRLNQMAWQYGAYLQCRMSITPTERQYANYLIVMINEVETEGKKVENDLQKDVLKELAKVLVRGYGGD